MSGVVEKLRRCVEGTKSDHTLDSMYVVELTRGDARLLVDLFDAMADQAGELRATLDAREGALDGYRKLERMDRVAFIREAFLAIVKGCGDESGNVMFDDATVWKMARLAWDTKPEDC